MLNLINNNDVKNIKKILIYRKININFYNFFLYIYLLSIKIYKFLYKKKDFA